MQVTSPANTLPAFRGYPDVSNQTNMNPFILVSTLGPLEYIDRSSE